MKDEQTLFLAQLRWPGDEAWFWVSLLVDDSHDWKVEDGERVIRAIYGTYGDGLSVDNVQIAESWEQACALDCDAHHCDTLTMFR